MDEVDRKGKQASTLQDQLRLGEERKSDGGRNREIPHTHLYHKTKVPTNSIQLRLVQLQDQLRVSMVGKSNTEPKNPLASSINFEMTKGELPKVNLTTFNFATSSDIAGLSVERLLWIFASWLFNRAEVT